MIRRHGPTVWGKGQGAYKRFEIPEFLLCPTPPPAEFFSGAGLC